MIKKRCTSCQGSGRVMGGGMMMDDCNECDGTGKIFIQEKDDLEILEEANKNKKLKEKAKKEINKKYSSLSDEDVNKIVDEAFEASKK